MNGIYQKKVEDFLNQKNIAVAGYSLQDKNTGNFIYEKLAGNGYRVFAVNPKAGKENNNCYPNLKSIPHKLDAVMITAPPEAAINIIEQCIEQNIKRVWMHRSIDNGSYSAEAETLARANGISVINIGCPMMFVKPDIFHKCFRWFMSIKGKFNEEEKAAME
ncbi:MAG: CoA-binding protein [Cyclobacteriaceae bacterium]